MLRRFALLALGAALLAVPTANAQVPAPDDDPFYKAPRQLMRCGAAPSCAPARST